MDKSWRWSFCKLDAESGINDKAKSMGSDK